MKDDKQQKIFTKNLNRLISGTDKSQKEIASAVGVSPQTFNTWCQGIAFPRMGKIQALADYFKTNKSDLIEEYPPKEHLPENSSPALSEIDKNLLSFMHQLNKEGQEKVIGYAADLIASNNYKSKEVSKEEMDSVVENVLNEHAQPSG